MRNLTFNFANEANIIACIEHDDGTITIPEVNDSPVFESMTELAQNYAQARGVKPENFKSWTLLEDGTCYTYVLRAGTAGIASADIAEELAQACDAARAEFPLRTLDVTTVTRALVSCADVENALIDMNAQAHLTDIVNFVYNRLEEAGCFAAVQEEVEAEDTRSEFEIFVDNCEHDPNLLAIVAHTLRLPITASKEEILAAFPDTSKSAMQRFLIEYNATVSTFSTYDIESTTQAVLVMSQNPVGEPNQEAKRNLMVATKLADRDSINMKVLRIGRTGVLSSTKYISLAELQEEDMYVVDGVNVLLSFDETVDAEIEAKRAEEAAARVAYDDEDYDDYDDGDDDYED